MSKQPNGKKLTDPYFYVSDPNTKTQDIPPAPLPQKDDPYSYQGFGLIHSIHDIFRIKQPIGYMVQKSYRKSGSGLEFPMLTRILTCLCMLFDLLLVLVGVIAMGILLLIIVYAFAKIVGLDQFILEFIGRA